MMRARLMANESLERRAAGSGAAPPILRRQSRGPGTKSGVGYHSGRTRRDASPRAIDSPANRF
jgi:hypothetical protein